MITLATTDMNMSRIGHVTFWHVTLVVLINTGYAAEIVLLYTLS